MQLPRRSVEIFLVTKFIHKVGSNIFKIFWNLLKKNKIGFYQ